MFAKRLFYVCAGLLCLATGQRRRHAASILTVVMRAVVTVPVLAGLLSCAAYRVAASGDPKLAEGAIQAYRVRVAEYTLSDGRYHRFEGYLIHTADSLVFVQRAAPARFTTATSPERVLTLPRDQVLSDRLQEGVSLPRSVLFSTSLLAFLALMWAATGGGRILSPFTPL